ncbi:MAG: methyltransferase, TIGR04325 family [Chloroflexi bacterium]|nr:methyltransferase, TIGR04325 family [Chloroflexota bacterium]
MKYQDFIPPILYKVVHRFVSISSRRNRTFESYAAALESCRGRGYEDSLLVDVVYSKTIRLRKQADTSSIPLQDSTLQSLAAILMAQNSNRTDEFIIMDFGGACGAHYFMFRPLLPSGVKIRWIVVETPAMVRRGRGLETEELRFHESILGVKARLGHVDLIHSSGTLQYVPDPENTVREMLDCAPNFLFLNRLALSAKDKIITLQESLLSSNGPGPMPEDIQDRLCRYPVTYFPKARFENLLCQKYNIRFRLGETLASFSDTPLFTNGGYLAERRA